MTDDEHVHSYGPDLLCVCGATDGDEEKATLQRIDAVLMSWVQSNVTAPVALVQIAKLVGPVLHPGEEQA